MVNGMRGRVIGFWLDHEENRTVKTVYVDIQEEGFGFEEVEPVNQ